jgi:TPR repeat protein
MTVSGGKTIGRVQRALLFGFGGVVALLAAGIGGLPARADYTDGIIASTKVSEEAGIRIWRKEAWQNDDFLSAIRLGDIYDDERGDNKFFDPVEAYVWYYLSTASDRIHEDIGDENARRVIANDFHRALGQQEKLMLLLSADQREQARNRIIYILACRGPEGYIKLGQLHSTVYGSDGPGPRGRPGYGDYAVDSPDTYAAMGDVWHSERSFHDRAWHEYNYGDAAAARHMMGIPSSSVIIPNDGEALMYFHIADNMGHPLAREYLRGLDAAVRGARGLGPRISSEAAEKAKSWVPLYEFYPPGDTASGVPHTDECSIGFDRERSLALVNAAVPPHDVQQALWFLGWTTTPFARWGGGDLKAVARFQATIGDDPSGRLIPLEVLRLIQTAAQRGDAASQNTLGVMYAKGIGVPLNYVRAEYWFKKSGDQRYAAALYHLGVLYKVGPNGIKQDLSKSNDYMTASALAGFKPTMNQLYDLLGRADAGPHREGHQ